MSGTPFRTTRGRGGKANAADELGERLVDALADVAGVNTDTARRVYERKERYLEEAEASL